MRWREPPIWWQLRLQFDVQAPVHGSVPVPTRDVPLLFGGLGRGVHRGAPSFGQLPPRKPSVAPPPAFAAFPFLAASLAVAACTASAAVANSYSALAGIRSKCPTTWHFGHARQQGKIRNNKRCRTMSGKRFSDSWFISPREDKTDHSCMMRTSAECRTDTTWSSHYSRRFSRIVKSPLQSQAADALPRGTRFQRGSRMLNESRWKETRCRKAYEIERADRFRPSPGN